MDMIVSDYDEKRGVIRLDRTELEHELHTRKQTQLHDQSDLRDIFAHSRHSYDKESCCCLTIFGYISCPVSLSSTASRIIVTASQALEEEKLISHNVAQKREPDHNPNPGFTSHYPARSRQVLSCYISRVVRKFVKQ